MQRTKTKSPPKDTAMMNAYGSFSGSFVVGSGERELLLAK